MKRTTTKTAAAGSEPPMPWDKSDKKGKKDLRGSPEAIRKRLATMRKNKAKRAKGAAKTVKAKKANGAAPVRVARAPKPPKAVGSQRFLAVQRARGHIENIDRLIEQSSVSGTEPDLKELRISSLLALKELGIVGWA
jgi:hypothetical protein